MYKMSEGQPSLILFIINLTGIKTILKSVCYFYNSYM